MEPVDVHEAGHALAALREGFEIQQASSRGEKLVLFEPNPKRLFRGSGRVTKKARNALEADIRISIAGPVAQAFYTDGAAVRIGSSLTAWGGGMREVCDGDEGRVRFAMARLYGLNTSDGCPQGDEDFWDAEQKTIDATAQSWLGEFAASSAWPAVLAIARVLATGRTLAQADFASLPEVAHFTEGVAS